MSWPSAVLVVLHYCHIGGSLPETVPSALIGPCSGMPEFVGIVGCRTVVGTAARREELGPRNCDTIHTQEGVLYA